MKKTEKYSQTGTTHLTHIDTSRTSPHPHHRINPFIDTLIAFSEHGKIGTLRQNIQQK